MQRIWQYCGSDYWCFNIMFMGDMGWSLRKMTYVALMTKLRQSSVQFTQLKQCKHVEQSKQQFWWQKNPRWSQTVLPRKTTASVVSENAEYIPVTRISDSFDWLWHGRPLFASHFLPTVNTDFFQLWPWLFPILSQAIFVPKSNQALTIAASDRFYFCSCDL